MGVSIPTSNAASQLAMMLSATTGFLDESSLRTCAAVSLSGSGVEGFDATSTRGLRPTTTKSRAHATLPGLWHTPLGSPHRPFPTRLWWGLTVGVEVVNQQLQVYRRMRANKVGYTQLLVLVLLCIPNPRLEMINFRTKLQQRYGGAYKLPGRMVLLCGPAVRRPSLPCLAEIYPVCVFQSIAQSTAQQHTPSYSDVQRQSRRQ